MSVRTRGWLVALVALALAALAPACGEKASPVAPHVNTPPEVLAMFPAPRAVGVFYDTQVWVQFDRALDAASVDTGSVYLKLDTRRTPITVQYQRGVNRIQILPRYPLELGRTYTAEVSAHVRTTAGDSLGAPLRWQFTTNTLRRITYTLPEAGALEGPHALLQWGGNGGPSNTLMYEVYASSDSAAVANRTIAPVQTSVFVNYLPRMAWASGRRTFWAVTAINLTTGERLGGDVTSFDVYPADAPTDSVVLSVADFGGAGSNNRVQFCATTTIQTGPAFNSGVRWTIGSHFPDVHVADARLTMYATAGSAAAVGGANTQAWFAQNTWGACAFTLGGAPYAEVNGLLSGATVNGLRADFRDPGLAAFVEAAGRWGGWNGVLFRGTGNVTWEVMNGPNPGPSLTVWYYRTPTAAAGGPSTPR